jgi:hypothetical protein
LELTAAKLIDAERFLEGRIDDARRICVRGDGPDAGRHRAREPPRSAAVYVIVVTPGIIAFAFAQRLFFKGLMEGVLKA